MRGMKCFNHITGNVQILVCEYIACLPLTPYPQVLAGNRRNVVTGLPPATCTRSSTRVSLVQLTTRSRKLRELILNQRYALLLL